MAERRDEILYEIFHVLDQKQRGFVSKVELSHILDAMQADANGKLRIPESLSPRKIQRDCRVNLQDMSGWLEELTISDLEDVKWFAESVVNVETELRDQWLLASQRWREDLLLLQHRELQRYLHGSQPPRVARWLQLREDSETRPGLGYSRHEVETLFAANTAEEINGYREQMQPFVRALELRRQLEFGGALDQLALLREMNELAQQPELAALLIHEDTLGSATKCTQSSLFSAEVMTAASQLIMSLLSHHLHCGDSEKCKSMLYDYLELGYDPEAVEAPVLPVSPRSRSSVARVSASAVVPPKPQSISVWVENLVTTLADLDRGDMLDKLIRYDEQRLRDPGEEVAESFFSHGRTISILVGRLNLASHHTKHERRTPLRTHLLKFLLNILSSSGERGRRLFRAAKGIPALTSLLRGDSWGEAREERPEEDLEGENEELGWPGLSLGMRFYPADFVDDKFYGPKDRVLAAALLEYLASDEIWGEERLLEEMMTCPELLQVLCRVPTCLNLLRMMLRQPRFPELLEKSASHLAKRSVQKQLRPLLRCGQPLAAPWSFGGLCCSEHKSAWQAFQQAFLEAETKNGMLRLLSFMYHQILTAQGVDPEDQQELSRLLAAQLPPEVLPLAMSAYLSPCEAATSCRSSECFYLLRLVQLIQIQRSLPQFVADLEVRLQALCYQEPFEALCLTVSLRPELLQRFPRSTPLQLVQSLVSLLREYTEPVHAARQELQVVLFSQLCFYMPWQRPHEESAGALWAELGLSERKLRKVQEILVSIPSNLNTDGEGSYPNCRLLHRESLSLLQLTLDLDEQMLTLIHANGHWMLWANSLGGSALTECSKVPKYFGL